MFCRADLPPIDNEALKERRAPETWVERAAGLASACMGTVVMLVSSEDEAKSRELALVSSSTSSQRRSTSHSESSMLDRPRERLVAGDPTLGAAWLGRGCLAIHELHCNSRASWRSAQSRRLDSSL